MEIELQLLDLENLDLGDLTVLNFICIPVNSTEEPLRIRVIFREACWLGPDGECCVSYRR